MNILQQSEIYINSLQNRKRNPAKPSTLNSYNCYLRKWIVPLIGLKTLEEFENGEMKDFIGKLDEHGLSPATIAGIQNCVKGIFSSCIDGNGNELFVRKWNTDFIDAPPIDQKEQKAPTITPENLQEAISKSEAPYSHLLTLLAATGLRIGEALALKVGLDDNSSVWDSKESKLIIRKGLYRGKEQSTKTPAGNREVDISSVLNDLLKTMGRKEGDWLFEGRRKGTIRPMTAYVQTKKVGVPGFHSLRRFRITYLENSNVPPTLVKFWVGHANGDITARYVKSAQDIKLRKELAEKVGLGFELKVKS